MLFCVVFVFFFKQKTAYEMRISDWSSDVCSSDLEDLHVDGTVFGDGSVVTPGSVTGIRGPAVGAEHSRIVDVEVIHEFRADGVRVGLRLKIGRASCRERVCQYV